MRVALRFRRRREILEEVGKHRYGVGLHFGVGLQIHLSQGDLAFLWIEWPALHTLREAVPVAEKLQEKWRELVDDHFDIYCDPCDGYNFVTIASRAAQMEPDFVEADLRRRVTPSAHFEEVGWVDDRHPNAGSHGSPGPW